MTAKNEAQLNDFLADLGNYANENSLELYLVGGCIRDELLKTQSKDYDLVLNDDAITFIKSYIGYQYSKNTHSIKVLESHEQFKTIKISVDDLDYDIELASARSESYKEPAAFPKVELIKDISQDLQRRDFTINALIKSLMPANYGEIIDHVNAQDDIKNKLVRVFHDESFIDDPTRIYRAARFMAKYDLEIEEHTMELIEKASQHADKDKWLKKRKNRFQIELDYINKLEKDKASKAKDLLAKLEMTI